MEYAIYGVLALNIITFAAYWLDKQYAKQGSLRIPESTLLLLALVGGSPAALLARRFFSHKTRKNAFVLRFRLILCLQLALVMLAAFIWQGSR